MKCARFLVSTNSKLCHVTRCPTILLHCLGQQQSPQWLLLRSRQPFVRNNVVANGVSLISNVQAGKSSYTDCIALTSKVQRNAVGWKPRSSVVISFPYSSAIVRYSTGRRRIRRRKRRNAKTSWTFSTRWHVFAWRNGYHCLLYDTHFHLECSIHSISTL